MQRGSAAQSEVGWVVTYNCVSVYKVAWFLPLCFKIIFSFVKGE